MQLCGMLLHQLNKSLSQRACCCKTPHLVCTVVVVVCVYKAFQDEGRWRVLPGSGAERMHPLKAPGVYHCLML
jgi:hypothetical protein